MTKRWWPWRLVVAMLVFAVPCAAQSPAPKAPPPVEVPVVVLNRQITTFRGSLYGVDPQRRALSASARVKEILDRSGPGGITIKHEPLGNIILIDGSLGLALTPDDADRLDGETLDEATEATRRRLERVIADTRESRDKKQLIRAAIRAGIATLALLIACFLTVRMRRALVVRLTNLLTSKTSRVQVGGASVVHASRLFALSRWVVNTVSSALVLLLLYEWTTFSLNQFPYTRPFGEQLDGYLVGVVSELGGGMLRAIPDLLVALLIFLLARGLLGVFRSFFDSVERQRVDLGWIDAETARATRRIFNLIVWTFAVVMAYPYLPGSGSEAFRGVSVLFGLMITLGGSSLFGQAASGLILMYSRTLRVGEFVRISDQEGTITELGAFTTRIRTGLGEELTLPNALVLSTVTKNYSRTSRGKGFILDTIVTIGYDTPWRQVQAMLVEGALRTPGIVREPSPRVFATELSDFYVHYRLVCQCVEEDPRPRAMALHDLHANVLDVFNEHGVQIMSPHYLGDPAQAKIVPPAEWYAAPARPPEQKSPGPTEPDSSGGRA